MQRDTSQQPTAEEPQKLSIWVRFVSYNSPFLALMIPALIMRYLWIAVEDINPGNFLKKDPSTRPGFIPWKRPGIGRSLSLNFASLGVGASLMGILGYYSKNTHADIRTLYAEAVGYELDKKPEDVTWRDIFVRSENSTLEVTRAAFFKRTAMRAAAVGSFFVPWHWFRDFHFNKPKYDANLNAGVGVLGTYLTLDGFLRKPSFFDGQQQLIGASVSGQKDGIREKISGSSIAGLLMLQRKQKHPNYVWPELASLEGIEQERLAARIADLMNQTYRNTPMEEPVHFTIGKFNFLAGFGMLDHFPTSLAFVELASRSPDMKAVKQVAAAIEKGTDAAAAFAQQGIDLSVLSQAQQVKDTAAEAPPLAKFTHRVTPARGTAVLADGPRSHQAFAAQESNALGQGAG